MKDVFDFRKINSVVYGIPNHSDSISCLLMGSCYLRNCGNCNLANETQGRIKSLLELSGYDVRIGEMGVVLGRRGEVTVTSAINSGVLTIEKL
ncbi:MAG TPA: hypothetical protein PK370_02335 [Candidatus Woesebacteria bacterium]|nr:hypothetical protein [Candidatus Woesebacteria bacterium]HPJ16600.1 hypothetical protein [Candidatus Woesebacteria bacterium]